MERAKGHEDGRDKRKTDGTHLNLPGGKEGSEHGGKSE